jgi:hypothetical protein
VLIAAISFRPAAQAGEKLSAEEIAALFPGQYEAVWKDKHEVDVEAGGTNGEISGSYGIIFGSGKWWIVGDQLCISSAGSPIDRAAPSGAPGRWFSACTTARASRVRFRPQEACSSGNQALVSNS